MDRLGMLQRTLWLGLAMGAMACAAPPAPTSAAPGPEPSASPVVPAPEPEPPEPVAEPTAAPPVATPPLEPVPASDHAEPIDVGSPAGSPADPGPMSSASRFQARLRAALRKCYERALASNPNLKGTLAVKLVVDAQGRVTGVKVTSGSGLDQALVQCIEARIRAIVLEPPPGTARTFEFPINIDSTR